MKVRLKQPWSTWSRGHVFPDMPGGQARVLIERGLAEEVAEAPGKRNARAPLDRALRSAGREAGYLIRSD